jgi:hypothetical protein
VIGMGHSKSEKYSSGGYLNQQTQNRYVSKTSKNRLLIRLLQIKGVIWGGRSLYLFFLSSIYPQKRILKLDPNVLESACPNLQFKIVPDVFSSPTTNFTIPLNLT